MSCDMAKMRTIKAAIRHIREADLDTAFTEYALRKLVLSGTISHIKIGSKRLVNLDDVEQYLAGSSTSSSAEAEAQCDNVVQLSELRKVG